MVSLSHYVGRSLIIGLGRQCGVSLCSSLLSLSPVDGDMLQCKMVNNRDKVRYVV